MKNVISNYTQQKKNISDETLDDNKSKKCDNKFRAYSSLKLCYNLIRYIYNTYSKTYITSFMSK